MGCSDWLYEAFLQVLLQTFLDRLQLETRNRVESALSRLCAPLQLDLYGHTVG